MLTTDHREMLQLLRRIERTEDLDERRDIADTVIAEVMRHSVAEEMIVYPSVEEHIAGGKDAVEHDKEEHEELVGVMKDLEGLDVTEGAFLEKVIEFEQLLDHHARDEEDEQFPKLREHIPQDQLIDMGKRVVSAKKVAPPRPNLARRTRNSSIRVSAPASDWSIVCAISSPDANPDASPS